MNLDAEIAERIMGWRELEADSRLFYVKKCTTGKSELEYVAAIDWTPFTDISDAWMVVEKMRGGGAEVYIETKNEKWWFCFALTPGDMGSWFAAEADTLPEAICRAALEAVGSQS